jgi:hypothetical protein
LLAWLGVVACLLPAPAARGQEDPKQLTFPSEKNTQTLITCAFSGRELLIERVYRESGSFRDLCGDYRKCASALERWRRLGGASSPRVDEYAELLDELAEEIEAWLDAVAVCATLPCEGCEA